MFRDSVCIGDQDNSSLRTVSWFTGGYKFVPKNVEDATGLCELEPVLSIFEREVPKRQLMISNLNYAMMRRSVKPDPFTRDNFPARKNHESLHDTFVRVTNLEKTATQELSRSIGNTSIRSRRLLLEIREVAAQAHPSYDVYVSESNMGFWKIVLQGPGGSAYASGTFVLYLAMAEDYPRRAQNGRFITPVFHPNVNRHGRIW